MANRNLRGSNRGGNKQNNPGNFANRSRDEVIAAARAGGLARGRQAEEQEQAQNQRHAMAA